MVAPARKPYITPEEYLRREQGAECKSEYWNGVIVAMAGGTKAHERLSGNFYHTLRNHLDGSPCEPFTGNMSVHIPAHNRYVYPDVSVACAPQFIGIDGIDVLVNPVVVVEILSKSTAATDMTTKRYGYCSLPSLKAYVVAAQDTPRIEVFTPLPDGSWESKVVEGLEATLALPCIGVELPLADVYRRVEFSSDEENEPERSRS